MPAVSDDDQAPDRSSPDAPERAGPSTWLVIGATLAAAAVVTGLVLAALAWIGRGDDTTAPATTTDETAPATTAELAPSGDLLIRRQHDGLELRAAIQRWEAVFDGRGGGAVVVAADAPFGSVELMVGTAPVPPPGGGAPAASTEATPNTTSEVTEATAPSRTTVTATTATTDPADLDGNAILDVCEPRGDVVGWAIDDDEILQGTTPWTEGRVGGVYPGLMWGSPDSHVLAVVIVVDADVETVTLQVGGETDQMTPVDGVAVLGVRLPEPVLDQQGNPSAAARSLRVQARRADGTTMTSDRNALDTGHPAWNMSGPCAQMFDGTEDPILAEVPATIAPPTLPEPGTEQPADPAGAEAAITAAYRLVSDADADLTARLAVVDDPSQMDELLPRLDEWRLVDGTSVADIADVVFVSPVEAIFSFDVSQPQYVGRTTGRARFVDGAWKITRGTVCGLDTPIPCPP